MRIVNELQALYGLNTIMAEPLPEHLLVSEQELEQDFDLVVYRLRDVDLIVRALVVDCSKVLGSWNGIHLLRCMTLYLIFNYLCCLIEVDIRSFES